jgi:hypothetical protein
MQSITARSIKSITACAVFAAGCAGAPPATVAPTATDAPAPATHRAQVPTEVLATARRLGYKPKFHGDDLVFCKTSTDVGSHMPESTCIDEAHLDAMARAQQQGEDNTRNTMERLQRQPTCSPGSAC